jgi:predicted enzyme related to lactoylglutathione lyase
MANTFCHFELSTSDIGKAKKFYSQLFDWKLEDMPMGNDMTYTVIKPAEGPGGGMMQMAEVPPQWLTYVKVDDIKTATTKAKSLGATIIKEAVEVPNMGWFTIMTDPTGAAIAMWQGKTQ